MKGASVPVLLLVGGIGRMEPQYRKVAAERGYELDYERREPPAPHRLTTRGGAVNRPAAIVVFTAVCSHPQREAAQRLAEALGLTVHYLRQPSVSALRRALAALPAEGAHAR